MEAFFSGLDCRLRGSGKVADSIMMGIVNSAMETAYKKSLSKEGDLERLNEKSRFCELAIMQLEWCLKFLQEEMDIESTDDREQLLADLLETRDRIQRRLWETEIAIAEKDRELTRSRKSESKLRVALEVKGEEMSSLLTALGSERVKGERANEPVQCSKMSEKSDGGHMFSECKSSVDQQICKISGKLENGRQILTTVMQKLGGSSSNIEKVDLWIDDSDGMKTLSDLYNMAQLLMEFEEVIMDAGILKESIDSSFEMMVSSIDLFKTALDEHQWVANTEKEMSSIILKNILREAQDNCNVKPGSPYGSPPSQLDWSALLDDITTLQDDLVLLISKIDMQLKTDDDIKLHTHHHLSSRTHLEERSKCDTGTVEDKLHRSGGNLESGHDAGGAVDSQEFSNSSHSKRLGDIGGLSKENSSGYLVTDLISKRKSIIRTKSQETNWLKGELSREKGKSFFRYDRKFNALKEAIAAAIGRLDTIKRQKAMLVVACPDDRLQDYKGNKNSFQHNLTGFGSLEKEHKSQSVRGSQLSNNSSCCYLAGAEPCEEIRKLIEDKIKLEFQSGLLEDIYKILFKDLIRRRSIETFDYYIKTIITEDTFRVIICTIINEWNGIVETLGIERLLKDEIDWIIFSAITKDIIGMHYMSAIEEEHKAKLLSNDFVLGEGSDFNYDSGLMQPQFYTSFDEFKAGEHDECNIQNVEILVEENDAFNSVSEKFEKALQQIVKSKMQLKELASGLGVGADDTNATCDQITPVIDVAHDRKPSPPGFPDWQWNDQQYVLMPFTQFSQELMSFELMACERIRKNISRLEDLKKKLGPLVEQVSLIKRTEVLYTKAFTRRCYDLQTAEAEVDLLGDQVDILLGLIKKIYIELDHYSPVLQHHVGMTEILDSLKKELDVELSRVM